MVRSALIALLSVVAATSASAQEGPITLRPGTGDAPEQRPRPPEADPEALEIESAQRRAASQALTAQADATAAEIALLQTRLVDAARELDRAERSALAAAARLRVLDGEARALELRVAADRERLSETLAALQRLARANPPAMAASPGDAADAARAAGLFAEIAPLLEARAAAARTEIDRLQDLRAAIERERESLAQTEAALSQRRDDVQALLAERERAEAALREDALREQAEADALAARARSLRELIAALRAEEAERARQRREALQPPASAGSPAPNFRLRPDPGGVAPEPRQFFSSRFADARGTLSPPAAGSIIRRFEGSGADARAFGLTFETQPQAQVTSPFDAEIRFAGRFLNYGELLILDVGDGYHIVLGGLSEVYGVTGQSVLAGEPLGKMPDAERPSSELYMEVWRDGQPIDPEPWLRS